MHYRRPVARLSKTDRHDLQPDDIIAANALGSADRYGRRYEELTDGDAFRAGISGFRTQNHNVDGPLPLAQR